MGSVLFLESFQGTASLFTLGLLSGARVCGWTGSVRAVADGRGAARPASELCGEIRALAPDIIVFLMDAAFGHPSIENIIPAHIPCLSLWFDDFLRSPQTLGAWARWQTWQASGQVQVCLWDGWWRDRWRDHTNHTASAVHLAADPADFVPAAQPFVSGLEASAVMVGTVPSLASLQQDEQGIPTVLHPLLREAARVMEQAPWPIRAYDIFQLSLGAAPAKIRIAAERWMQLPQSAALVHRQVWRLGKRAARVRGLRAVAGVMPVALLSGHGTESYAGGDEIRAELPPGTHFVYQDTRSVGRGAWSGLFTAGAFQLQITDPQSIESGVPYRVFETAACGRPLLTDTRPGLPELFPGGGHLYCASDEEDLAARSLALAALSDEERQEVGGAGRQLFLESHTWEKRWIQVAGLAQSPPP